MKTLDHILQSWRIATAVPHIPPGSRVLDVGCADGALFRKLGGRLGEGVGLDPLLDTRVVEARYRLLPGEFPADAFGLGMFDCIVMLAVIEHLPDGNLRQIRSSLDRLLAPGGRVVITVPSARTDRLLEVLKALRLIDGMSLEEHHGFDVARTEDYLTTEHVKLMVRKRFQLGFNNLFVFENSLGQ